MTLHEANGMTSIELYPRPAKPNEGPVLAAEAV